MKKRNRKFVPVAIEPKYQIVLFGDLQNKVYYSYPKTFHNNWTPFIQLLLKPEYDLIQHVHSCVAVSELDEYSKHLVYLSESEGVSLPLLKKFIELEIHQSDSPATLFRNFFFPLDHIFIPANNTLFRFFFFSF